jgi:hypothetical protein
MEHVCLVNAENHCRSHGFGTGESRYRSGPVLDSLQNGWGNPNP